MSVGVLLVYDITNRNSFVNLTDWLNDVKKNLDYRNAVFFLVATKSDLNKLRQVREEEGRQFAKLHNMSFKETSSKLGTNVQEVFNSIAEQIYDRVQSGELGVNSPAITKFNFSNNAHLPAFPLKRLRSVDDQESKCKCCKY